MNMDYDLTKWLTFNTNISYNNRYVVGPRDGLDGNNSGFYDAPAGPAYTPNGDFYDFYVCGRSPLSAMKGGGEAKQEFETMRYSNTLTAHVTKDFTITGQWSFIKNNNVQTETKTHYYVGWWDGSKQVEINAGNNQYVQERIQRTFYENYMLQADYSHAFG